MTVTVSIPLPAPAANDPIVRRHVEQRHVLEAKLANAQGRIAALKDEQTALQEAAHERKVNQLLGSRATGEENAIRLSQIPGEIAVETAAALAASDALERHAVIAAGVRHAAQGRCDDEVRTAAREVVAQMATHGAQLFELSERLQQLVDLSPGLRLPTPPAMLLMKWFDEVRRLEAGGYR